VAMMGDAALEVGWFIPGMLVDNPLSLAGGREIYGYNKMWGKIEVPAPGPAARMSLEAYGGDFDRTRPAGFYPLIDVELGGESQALAAQTPRWSDLAGVVSDARRALAEARAEEARRRRLRGAESIAERPAVPEPVWEAILAQGGPPQFFLRQLRAVN